MLCNFKLNKMELDSLDLEHAWISILGRNFIGAHDSLEDKIKQIDDYMCQYIETHAARLFKNKSVNYKPLLLTKEDYPSLIRCKINISGSKACRFWTHQFARCDMPEDLRNCGLVPRVHFKSLWIMGSEAGISL